MLADRVENHRPACAVGIAIAQRLITDALRSLLPVDSDPEMLGRLVRTSLASMDDVEPRNRQAETSPGRYTPASTS